MLRRDIGDYHFIANKTSGNTARWGKTLDDDPLFAPVPELADISVSNYCTKGCDFCYKNSNENGRMMSIDDFCFVLDSLQHPQYGNVFQVALGGGEPFEHPEILRIIDETVKRGIVPNITTNGLHLSSEMIRNIAGKIGALAVSAVNVNNIDHKLFDELVYNGIKTNLHYVLSNKNIPQAVDILKGKYNDKLSRINAVVFLTYKPGGRGYEDDVIRNDDRLITFLEAIKSSSCICKIGFDACFVPILLKNTNINRTLIDTCEAGLFSVYIDELLNVSPCSFSGEKDKYSLREYSFYDIWTVQFAEYRKRIVNDCASDCPAKSICRGACPYFPQITKCYQND